MNIRQIEIVIENAERFIRSAKTARGRIERDCQAQNHEHSEKWAAKACTTISKETAACRRASLDLTRALAELRK